MRHACQLAAFALLAALAGCERASAFKPGTQMVVAKVNGVEISARDRAERALERDHRPRRWCEALAAGLDRDPQVAQRVTTRGSRWRRPTSTAPRQRPRSTPLGTLLRREPGAVAERRSTGCASWRCRCTDR
jgi:hypothetical protein